LPNEIILRFPIDIPSKYSKYTDVDNNIIYKKNGEGDYEIVKNCVNKDYINKSKNGEYLENGNLKNLWNGLTMMVQILIQNLFMW